MSFESGARLGPFTIVERLGAGGMGEVYRARDERLQRDVAVKVLPHTMAEGSDGRGRFEREARAAARISHPNIVPVYDVGLAGDQPYIVTELVEGRTLRQLLAAGPMTPKQAVTHAIQIAEALAAAHEQGVVHRDLKPENVIVSEDGRARVLDFGIAKVREPALSDSAGTRFATDVGVVVGTAAYMSPEQVRGEPLDARSDLFACGAVLYEMLTGRQAFGASVPAESMAAILRDEPPDAMPVGAAPMLRDIVRHCLEKRAVERFQSARDLAFSLRAVGGPPGAAVPAPPGTRATWTRAAGGLVVVGALAATAGFLAASWRGTSADAPGFGAMTQMTFAAGAETFPQLSNDGSWLVYAGTSGASTDIFLRNSGGQAAINLTGDHPGDDSQPSLSPDGSQIAFRSERDGGGVFIMGRMGESPRRLTRAGFNPTWSPDGRSIAIASERVESRPDTRSPNGSNLSIVDVASGAVRQVTSGDAVQPAWAPGGRRLAYWGLRNRNQRDLWTIDLDGGDPVPVTNDPALDWSPLWSPDGEWLYFSSDRGGSMNLWRIRIDDASGAVRGRPEPFTLPSGWVAHASFSADGRRLAIASYLRSGNLQRWAFDPEREVFVGDIQTLTSGSQFFLTPSPSHDGKSIVFLAGGGSGQNVMVANADGTGIRQLTVGDSRASSPRWSPDGSRVAFHSSQGGQYRIWTIDADGSNRRVLTEGTELGWAMRAWSPDGDRIAAIEPVTIRAFLVDARRTDSLRPPEPLPTWDGGTFEPESWSSDGKWIVGESGRGGIVVYATADRTYRVLSPEGTAPQWLSANRVVFTLRGRMVVADLSSGAVRSIGVAPGVETSASTTDWRLSADGRSAFRSLVTLESDIWVAAIP